MGDINERTIGKIAKARFGYYDESSGAFGFHFDLSGSGWGVGHSLLIFRGFGPACTPAESEAAGRAMESAEQLLKDAKVHTLDQLVGKPVVVDFDGMVCRGFRIMTEVL